MISSNGAKVTDTFKPKKSKRPSWRMYFVQKYKQIVTDLSSLAETIGALESNKNTKIYGVYPIAHMGAMFVIVYVKEE
jgi:hypothetical protein